MTSTYTLRCSYHRRHDSFTRCCYCFSCFHFIFIQFIFLRFRLVNAVLHTAETLMFCFINLKGEQRAKTVTDTNNVICLLIQNKKYFHWQMHGMHNSYFLFSLHFYGSLITTKFLFRIFFSFFFQFYHRIHLFYRNILCRSFR